MKCGSLLVAGIALTLALPHTSHAATRPDRPDPKYQFIQITRFNAAPGVDFPDAYQAKIDEDLFRALQNIEGIKQVLRDGESLPVAAPVLQITGTVTKYVKGNRAARYLVGFGAGATIIDAHIQCYDARTKQLLFEHDVDGKVIIGPVGGKSEGANNGLAKEIAKDIKQKFF